MPSPQSYFEISRRYLIAGLVTFRNLHFSVKKSMRLVAKPNALTSALLIEKPV